MEVTLTSSKRPITLPNEVTYREQNSIEVFSDNTRFGFSELTYITTHRIIFLLGNSAFQVPLHYISHYKSSGGFIRSLKLKLFIVNHNTLPEYTKQLCSINNAPIPPLPSLPTVFLLKFRAEGRDSCANCLSQALSNQLWLQPLEAPKVTTQYEGYGMRGIRTTLEADSKHADEAISEGFQDLQTLFAKSRDLQGLAAKLKRMDASEDPELAEIKDTMAGLGFTSGVTKSSSGQNYHSQLAREISDYIHPVLAQKGGMIPLLDAFCMYNRARGGSLISPNDMNGACEQMAKLALPVSLHTLPSGVKSLQIGGNAIKELTRMAVEAVGTHEHLSAQALGEILNLNALIAKQVLVQAEQEGTVCRDQSIHGLRFYINLLKA